VRNWPTSRTEIDAEHERGPIVHVEPIGIDLELQPGETIIEAAWRHGYRWPTVCYGQADCTVCHVEVRSGEEHLTPVDDEERDALEQRLPGAGGRDLTRIRLACRAQATGDVTVYKPGVRPPPVRGRAGHMRS
jgi:ferredoxin, 2Fe-2S